MDNIAIDLVEKYILNHLDKSDAIPDFEVYTVWKCKILQKLEILAIQHTSRWNVL